MSAKIVRMVAWLTFFSTLVLVGVTGWYAVLTRSLARSARDSAKSAQIAAEYAAQSVAAAVASVNVAFGCSPTYDISEGESDVGVQLTSLGATVFVHGAFLDEAYECTEYGPHGGSYTSIVIGSGGHGLAADVVLPTRLHEGETLFFDPEPSVRVDKDVSVASMRIRVLYSLDGGGSGIEREVEWVGVFGKDFTVRESLGGGEATPLN